MPDEDIQEMQPSPRTEDFLVLEECHPFTDHGGQGEGKSCCLKRYLISNL